MIRNFPIPLQKVRGWYSFCKILPVVFPPPKSPSPSREYPPLKPFIFRGYPWKSKNNLFTVFFSVKTIVFSKGSLQSTFPGYYYFNGLRTFWDMFVFFSFFGKKKNHPKARCMEASPTKASKHRSNSSKLVFSPWLVSKFLQDDWSRGVVGGLKIWWHTREGWWKNVNMFPHKNKLWSENVGMKIFTSANKKNMVTWFEVSRCWLICFGVCVFFSEITPGLHTPNPSSIVSSRA